MKIKLSELKPNPFKRFINDGKLNEERVEMLVESVEHGTLPEHFFIRKVDENYEMTSGHHRVAALKKVKGKDHEVEVTVVKFTDEQMLVDMVRENITQRYTDFHDTRESIVLARGWLQSGATGVKQFHSHLKDGRKCPPQNQQQEDSYRSIAKFLSKNGKTICYRTVKNYLDITDNLSPNLLEKVTKAKHIDIEKQGDILAVTDAISLSRIEDYQEQEKLASVLRDSKIDAQERRDLVSTFIELEEEQKQDVLDGKILLQDFRKEKEPLTELEASHKFYQRANDLIIEMRTLRKALGQFTQQRVFDSFSPKQKATLKEKLGTIKKEYGELIAELENSIKVL